MNYMEARRLRGVPRDGLPVQALTVVAQPVPEPVHREDHRPDLSVARGPDHPHGLTCGTVGGRCGPTEEEAAAIEEDDLPTQASPDPDPETDDLVVELAEYCSEVDEIIDAITPEQTEQALTTLLAGQHTNPYGLGTDHAEREVTELLEFDPDRPETYACAQPGGDCGCTGTGLISCPGRSTEDDELNGLTAEQYRDVMTRVTKRMEADTRLALPPATDSPAPVRPKPRQLPCEVCGHGVLTSYVERTGRQRHGHHPDDAPSTNTLDFGEVSADD